MSDSAFAQLRVLAVDDNVDVADTLGHLLTGLGCRAAVAYDEATAVRAAELFQPHLVFLDLNMPGTDGCNVLDRVRGLSAPLARALYVCLTGSQQHHDEARCEAAGFDTFVRKPLRADQLEALLAQAQARLQSAAQWRSH